MFDQVVPMDNTTREKARENAENEARRKAVEAGADEKTLEVIDVMEVPLAYLPGNAVRYFLKVVGDLAESEAQNLEQLTDQGTKVKSILRLFFSIFLKQWKGTRENLNGERECASFPFMLHIDCSSSFVME